MTQTIRAYFDGKTLVPDEPVDLPLNRALTLTVESAIEPSSPTDSITGVELARSAFAGLWQNRTDIGDSLEFARQLRKDAETRR
ncbi:MAG: hypothetical protein FWD61_16670 [Phycisphaerales bacterium]|nr:hypothetical protein [Phycisphaerales bacterium]